MEDQYVLKLRRKLRMRYARFKNAGYPEFHYLLKQFWGFVINQPLLYGIIQELDLKSNIVIDDVEKILSAESSFIFDSEEKHILISYLLIKKCSESNNIQIEINISKKYTSEKDTGNILIVFVRHFISPLFFYFDERLFDGSYMLFLLLKYKHKCEWFRRNQLYEKWSENTKYGEKILAFNLYEYLYDNGVEFSIEPSSASGKADMVMSQKSNAPIIADAKIFNPDKGNGRDYISKGFRQIYMYTVDYNQSVGYLIIYKTCEVELKIPFVGHSTMIPYVIYNNKIIYYIIIDIYNYNQTASKRRKILYTELKEEAIWNNIEN